MAAEEQNAIQCRKAQKVVSSFNGLAFSPNCHRRMKSFLWQRTIELPKDFLLLKV